MLANIGVACPAKNGQLKGLIIQPWVESSTLNANVRMVPEPEGAELDRRLR
jgi:hypothetical protein